MVYARHGLIKAVSEKHDLVLITSTCKQVFTHHWINVCDMCTETHWCDQWMYPSRSVSAVFTRGMLLYTVKLHCRRLLGTIYEVVFYPKSVNPFNRRIRILRNWDGCVVPGGSEMAEVIW